MTLDNASTEHFSLNQLGKTKGNTHTVAYVNIPSDMLVWVQTWIRYCKEQRGTVETLNSVLASATIAWWNKQRRKIISGDGIKLPDWQCAIKNTEYATVTDEIAFKVPVDIKKQMMKAIRNGHIYANWHKATFSACVRVAIQQHYMDNHKYILAYLKQVAWHVDTP